MMLLIVNAVHAGSIATLIVDQNKALGTFSADITENVVLAAEDVDEALSLIEMVKVSALETRGFILCGSFAGN